MQDQTSPVAEIVTFRLIPGTDEAAFLRSAAATDRLLAGAAPCLGRHLSCDDDGLWTDHILWAGPDQAAAGAELIMADPTARPFLSAIAPESIVMRHAALRWQSGD
jgi:hypothetical protein